MANKDFKVKNGLITGGDSTITGKLTVTGRINNITLSVTSYSVGAALALADNSNITWTGAYTTNIVAQSSVTHTLPLTTSTLVGRDTVDTLTNKTFDTAGTGNVFKINGVAVSSVSGNGGIAALTNDPTFTGTVTVAALRAIHASEPIRIGYDAANYTSVVPATDGSLSLSKRLTLPAGSSTIAGGLKLTAGTLKTTPTAQDSGSIEYNGTDVYVVTGTGVRKALSGGTSSGGVSIAKIIALS